MKYLKNTIIPVLSATLWISISEFIRNELIVRSFWIKHYESLGLSFPSGPVNGAVWGVWSLLFAVAIYIIALKFNLIETTLLSWFVGFILMWIVAGNMGFLPYGILIVAVPLSLIEAFLASFIIIKLSAGRNRISSVE
jgi:hypothetical protein